MTDVIIGRVAVKVIPDTKTFRPETKRDLDKIEKSLPPIKLGFEANEVEAAAEAKKAHEAAEKAVRKAIRIRLDMDDQDEVRGGIRAIERELSKLKKRTEIQIDLNEGALNKELRKLKGHLDDIATVELRIEDGNVESLRSNVSRIDAELRKLREVPIDIKLDEESLLSARRVLEEELHSLTNNIDVRFNQDSLQSVRATAARIDAELDKLRETELRVDLDQESLEATRALLKELEEQHVKAEIEADNASFAAFRAKVDAIASGVEVHPSVDQAAARRAERRIEQIAEKLEGARLRLKPELAARDRFEIEREIDRLTDELEEAFDSVQKAPKVAVELTVDHSSVRSVERAIDKLRAQVEAERAVTIDVDVDRGGVEAALARLEAVRDAHIAVELDVKNSAFRELRKTVAKRLGDIEISPKLGTKAVDEARTRLDKMFHEVEERKLQITPDLPESEKFRLQREINSMEGEITVYLDELTLRTTQARLAWLGRTRFATIVPQVEQAAAAKAATTLAALSGGRSVWNITSNIGDWVGNLDKALPRISGMSLALTNLTSWLGASTSNALTFGASLASIGGTALALPGIFGGMALGLGATVAVLKDFNEVIPEAQTALEGLQDRMSSRFWAAAEAPFRRFGSTIFPQFSAGLEHTSDQLGGFFANLARSGEGILNNQLDSMFADLGESIGIAGDHTDSLIGIIEKLGEVGAGNLPRLAEWFGGLLDDFDGWLGEKGAEGLQAFIDTGIDALQDLGGAISATGGTFAALAEAAEGAGGSTLASVRDTMEGVERIVKGATFQHYASQAFKAFHDGTSELANEAGPEFADFMKRLSDTASTVLPTAGRTAGKALGAIFDALDQPSVQASTERFFGNLETAVDNLQPAMRPLAEAMAVAMDVVGSLATSVSGALGPALATVSEAIVNAQPEIMSMVDSLGDLLVNGVEVLTPVLSNLDVVIGGLARTVDMVVTPLNGLLDLMQLLPEPVGQAAGALTSVGLVVGGALWFGAAVRTKLMLFSTQMATAGTTAGIAGRAMAGAGAAAGAAAAKMTAARIGIGAAGIALTGMATQAGGANDKLGLLASAGGGAMMGFAVGGPWGAAIGAGAGAFMHLTTQVDATNDAMEAAAETATDYSGTLDGISGAATEAARQLAATSILEGDYLANLGAIEEQYGVSFGVTLRDMVGGITGNEEAWRNLQTQLVATMEQYGIFYDQNGQLIGGVDNLSTAQRGLINDLNGVLDPLEAQRGALEGTRRELADTRLAIGDYVSLLPSIPSDIATNLELAGSDVAVSDLEWLVGKYEVTPSEIMTLIELTGIAEADANSQEFIDLLAGLTRKSGMSAQEMSDALSLVNPDYSSIGSALVTAMSGAESTASTGGQSVGRQFSAGVRVGISDAAAQVAAAARLVAQNAVRAANGALQVRSPSRVMRQTGEWFSEGLAIGIQRAAHKVVKAATDVTKHIIYAATKQLGHTDHLDTLFDRVGDAYEKLRDKFKGAKRNQIGKMFGDDVSRLSSAVKNAATVSEILQQAVADLDALNQQVETFRAGVKDAFVSSGDPVTAGAKTFDGLIRGMEKARDRAVEFTASMAKLQSMGLDNTTLQQLAAAGPEAALGTVRALLQGGAAGVKQVAQLQAELEAQGVKFANTAGDQLYGPALSAAQNGVKDLTKHLQTLQSQIAKYANSLLSAMSSQLASTTVKAALGNIKGIEQLMAAIKAAQKSAAATSKATKAVTAKSVASSSAARAATSAAPSTVTNNVTNLHYYAAPGTSLDSEESLFDALSRAKGA